MKKIAIIIAFVFPVLLVQGTTHFTTVGDSGFETEVVAVVQTETRIMVSTYQYYDLPPGSVSMPAFFQRKISFDAGIPSILIGGEIYNFSQDMNALYVGGRVIKEPNYEMNNGWLYSRWLGWLNVRAYPTVYSTTEEWLYIHELNDEEYYIYNYSDENWEYHNLEEQWREIGNGVPLPE